MKRIILLIIILLLCGCGKKNYVTCDMNIVNKQENYTMEGTYKINYKGNYVSSVEKNEIIKSNDKSIIEYYYESKDLEYSSLKDLYGGYEYSISKNYDNIELKVNIDTNLLDIKKMVKDNKLDKYYVMSNKITKSGLIKLYESKGLKCN